MPILLWIIHCTQILCAFSIILATVTVWQFRGCTRIKLIHGYSFAVICVTDSAGEICGQLNILSHKCRNNSRNDITLYVYTYMFFENFFNWRCTQYNMFVSFCPRWIALCKILVRNEIFLGATSCRRNEQTRSVSRFRRMAWRKCSSLQSHGEEKM